MIVCVTPNAAIDRSLVVPDYWSGGVFRPVEQVVAAGGKGINVARVIRLMGGEPVCAGFLGGFNGNYVADLVRAEGLNSRWTFLAARETRTCVILLDPAAQKTTVVNERGPEVEARDWDKLCADVGHLLPEASHACFCGSLPPGTTQAIFQEVLAKLLEKGKPIWADTSGIGLRAAAEMPGVHLKVNHEEAGALLDRSIDVQDLHAVTDALQTLHQRQGNTIIITMGAHGAALWSAEGCWHVLPPAIAVRSAVGSGDSFFGAFLAAVEQGEPPMQALQRAAAAGAANALTVGGGHFSLDDFAAILAQTQITTL